MEKRRSNRTKHRLTCELLVGRETYSAVVRDLGPTGLFVQTRARPDTNSVIEVRFPATAGLEGFTIEAGVARHRNVHPRLQAEIQSGIGLEILGRPLSYQAYADRVGGTKSGPAPAAPSASAPRSTSLASTSTSTRATPPPTPPARPPMPTAASPRLPRPAAPAVPAESGLLRRYRIRMVAVHRSAPRTLVVEATSVAAARTLAAIQAGAGWKITDAETI